MRRIIFSILAVLIISCSRTPNKYEDEIIDAATYNIAVADYIIDRTNNFELEIIPEVLTNRDLMLEFSTLTYTQHVDIVVHLFNKSRGVINEIYQKGGETYKNALLESEANASEDGKKVFSELLKIYDLCDVALSEFELVSDTGGKELWQFTEIRSGIKFLFTYDSNESAFSCEPQYESYEEYILERLD